MSLVQLESFVAVAEEGHVGRAAQRLRVSQPPLTRRIRDLEAELGVALFERVPKGMRLLPSGAVFLAHARTILAQVDAARTSVREALAQREDDPLRLAHGSVVRSSSDDDASSVPTTP